MSRQFAHILRLFFLIFAGTAVLSLTAQAAPPTQEMPRKRFNIEDIPHRPTANTQQEVAFATSAPSALISWSKVAFQTLRNGNWDIYVGNDDGSGQTVVVASNGPEIHPHLNRGNTRIVFAAKSGSDYDIFTINVDGSGKTLLTNNGSDDGNPSWSPDGSKIVFESYRNGEADIYVMNANGTNQVRLTTHGDYDGMPTWSPDGSQIAFVSRRTGGYRIYVMNADGSGQVQISSQPYSLHPHWSPDGSQIAYDADIDGDGWQELWRMDADGSGQSQIYNPFGQTDAWAAGWSPDGNYITYTLISFIQYQGSWYWTEAYLRAVSLTGSYRTLGSGNTDWEPNWQTSDNVRPLSQIKSLSAQSPGPIYVSWSSSDSGGSGLRSYDVQVKVGAGSWSNWLDATPDKAALYPGVGGQTYAFRVRATDHAFNRESWPPTADATTTVESLPPISFIAAVPSFARFDEKLRVGWDGSDPGNSGIQNYDVQYRINGGSWINWQTDTIERTAVLDGGLSGDLYDFRVRAVDNAENQGSWSTGAGSGQTTFYTWGIEGTVRDNAGAPVTGVTLTTTPSLLGQLSPNVTGAYGGYIATESSSYAINWSNPDYTTLPDTTFLNGTDGEYDLVLPPANNLVADWGFESGGWSSGWQQGGTLPAEITPSGFHTGQFAARLGQPITFTSGTVPNLPDSFAYWFDLDQNGIGHQIIYNGQGNDRLSYQQLQPDGTWTAFENITVPEALGVPNRPEVIFEENGRIHLFWAAVTGPPNYDVSIFYLKREMDGQWSSPETVAEASFTNYRFHPVIGPGGTIHLLFTKQLTTTNQDALYYVYRQNSGWSTPLKLSENDNRDVDPYEMGFATGSDGGLHIVWVEKISGLEYLYYKERIPGLGWQPATPLVPNLTNSDHNFYHVNMLIDKDNHIHLFWETFDSQDLFYLEKVAGIGWQALIQLFNTDLQFILRPEYAVSDKNELFIVYFARQDDEDKIFLQIRDKDRNWQEARELRQGTVDADQPYAMGQLDIEVDAGSTAHIFWSEIKDVTTMDYQVIYLRKPIVGRPFADEVWEGPSEADSLYMPPQVIAQDFGQPYLFWQANSLNPLHYRVPQTAPSAGTYSISTEVTIPNNMANPLLSFVYDLAGAVASKGEVFTVTVDEGGSDTTILSTSAAASWQHFWYDMSAWAGQTITLNFAFSEGADSSVSHVTVDEVTIGSGYPDLWVTLSDTSGAIGERINQTIVVGNWGGALAEDVSITYNLPSGLAYRSATLAPFSTSPALVWQLGDLTAKSQPFVIEVELEILPTAPGLSTISGDVESETVSQELELLNNTSSGNIFIGRDLFIPAALQQ